jgi:hypothetical protein
MHTVETIICLVWEYLLAVEVNTCEDTPRIEPLSTGLVRAGWDLTARTVPHVEKPLAPPD